jgi:hypothetical protein
MPSKQMYHIDVEGSVGDVVRCRALRDMHPRRPITAAGRSLTQSPSDVGAASAKIFVWGCVL